MSIKFEKSEKVKQFEEATNCKVYAQFLGYDVNKNWGHAEKRPHYRIRFRRGNKQFSISFWDAVVHTEDDFKFEDVLGCLTVDWSYRDDLEDCGEMAKAVENECKRMENFFGEDGMDAMTEMFCDW